MVGGHATVDLTVKTTFFGRFKRFGKILKKVAERSRLQWSEVTLTVRRLVRKQRFSTFQAIRKLFVKRTEGSRDSGRWSFRLSADCQAHICMYIIINERERERGERERERETEYYVAFGRRIADEGVYEMLTCSKLNADLLDVFRGG